LEGIPIYNFLIDFLLIGFPLVFIKYLEKKNLDKKEFGFREARVLQSINITLKIFLALFIYSLLISLLLNIVGLNDFEGVEETIRLLASTEIILLAYLMIVRVFAEEIFFRAFLVPRTGVIISGILFGLLHYTYGSIGQVIGATILGIILGIAYKQNKLILPNFFAHLFYNLVVIYFAMALVQ
jgi:uncharacterized protein